MSTKSLSERLEEDEESIIDRRRISYKSRKILAEDIENGDTEAALKDVFAILTGEDVSEYERDRNVRGSIELTDSVIDELGDKGVRVEVAIADTTTQRTVWGTDESDSYTAINVVHGEHDVEATVVSAVEETEDEDGSVERTEYEVEDYELTVSSTTVDVDTSELEYSEGVEGPTVTIESIEVGGEK